MPIRRVMVTYRCKPESVARNEELVRAVYAQLAEQAPTGLRYSTFKQADGVSFVHVAQVDTPDGKNPLLALPAFQAFTGAIGERTEAPPVTTELTEVGSFRFW